MIFDSHIHLDHEAYDEDREELISSLYDNGVAYALNPGCDRQTSQKAYELANSYENIYGAVGNHPHDAKDLSQADLDSYEEMAKNTKIVAIGEIGFDFYYDHSPRKIQEEAFRTQLDLAYQLDLPILVHMRDATKETYEVLKAYNGKVTGVIHCYSEGWEDARKFLDLGYYIGLGGMVTFKKSDQTRQVAKNIPLESLLLETDGPYLSPEPKRGRRNEPIYIKYVAEKIADIRDDSEDNIIESTCANTMEMLGL